MAPAECPGSKSCPAILNLVEMREEGLIASVVSNEHEARLLLRREQPHLEVRELRAIHGGRDNLVFEVNGSWIFRFPRHEEVWLEGELRLLDYLQGTITLPIPMIRYAGENPRYSGYAKLGHEVLGDDVAGSRQDAIPELAGFLAELHAVDVQTALALGVERRPLVQHVEQVERDLKRLCGDETWLPFGLECLARVVERGDSGAEECLLHHDLHGDNVVLSKDRKDIAGVIDFGDACVGDVHRDFKPMCWHGFDAMNRLVDSYQMKTGRDLDRTRIKDYFCVVNLMDVIQFRSRDRVEVESAMLAQSEKWLSEWAEQDRQGTWQD